MVERREAPATLDDERWQALNEAQRVMLGLQAITRGRIAQTTLVRALRRLKLRKRSRTGGTAFYYSKDVLSFRATLKTDGYLEDCDSTARCPLREAITVDVLFRLAELPLATREEDGGLPSLSLLSTPKGTRSSRGRRGGASGRPTALDGVERLARDVDAWWRGGADGLSRDLYVALARRDPAGVMRLLGDDERWAHVDSARRYKSTRRAPPSLTAALERLPPKGRARADEILGDSLAVEDAAARLLYARVAVAREDGALALLDVASSPRRTPPLSPSARRELARALLLQGEAQAARDVLEPLDAGPQRQALSCWAALVERDAAAASRHAEVALTGKYTKAPDAPEWALGVLATLLDGAAPADRPHRLLHPPSDPGGELDLATPWLERLWIFVATGESSPREPGYRPVQDDRSRAVPRPAGLSPDGGAPPPPWDRVPAAYVWRAFFEGLLAVLTRSLGDGADDGESADVASAAERLAAVRAAAARAHNAGWAWLAGELDALAERLAAPAGASPARPSLVDLFQLRPAWEIKLARLEEAVAKETARRVVMAASKAAAPAQPKGPRKRLVWVIPRDGHARFSAEPREQSLGKRGAWTKGRRVALKRLHGAQPDYPHMGPEDRAVAAAIRMETYVSRGYLDTSYYLDEEAALDALMAHPRVFWEGDLSQPITIRRVKPRLELVRQGAGFRVHMVPPVKVKGLSHRPAGPYELEVTKATAAHVRLSDAVAGGTTVPARALERLERLVREAATVVEVASDVGGPLEGDERRADPTPVVRLAHGDGGLRVAFRVQPLGPAGPALRPGRDARRLVARVDGKTLSTERDLDEELARATHVVEACPALAEGYMDADGTWVVSDLEDALQTLLELGDLGDTVRLEWPRGAPLVIAGRVGVGQTRLRVRGGGARDDGWFKLSGEVQVDDELVLALGALVDLVSATPSRFVQLDDARFLVLTESLRRRLALLARAGTRRKDHVALHPWAVTLAEPLLDEVQAAGEVQAVRAWSKHIRARRQAAQARVDVPKTLRARLRDYQRQGFAWLARLASLGAGACLADDMGLGKTVQTLALLLTRAVAGPQLVVCPSSVVGVWLSEARRFAPTLRATRFGPGDRRAAVEGAGPFDVLVVSYGLLQSEPELLASRAWETVALDEAQHIKNPDTQRAKAAFALRAGFRVALTGTPVENRLDELWSIFRFLVPGLLGTRRGFQERFARPIEEHGDPDARAALRELVRPLLLRRLKAEVLDELPARTELELRVEPTAHEAALYEALRRRAVEALQAHADTPSGQRRVRVLAEITRLRRAACHPTLALGDALGDTEGADGEVPEGSKLEALGELLDELRAGGHRALVFSQFVGHLALVRRWLEAHDIPYQYLDGSTPPTQRDARVRAFQGGEGEVFLISLRAGGTGLNLTAADYVIHLDPWWNPAVEDQASDRAHRIGQTQPVTIVRLVAQGTIEERVLALHARKRRLAEDLLAGADAAAKLALDDLLALLAG